jgi:hypothetical protein
MFARVRLLPVLAALGLAVVLPGARAGDIIIVGILCEPHPSSDTIFPATPSLFGFEAAQEFTTGSKSYALESILANLGNLDPGKNGDFALTAALQADNGGNPGTVLATFNYDLSTIPKSGFAHVKFAPVSPVTLSSGVNYWFVLGGSSSDGSGGVDWSYAQTTASTGPGSLGLLNNSYDSGATWNGRYTPNSPNGPYLIQVNAAVPEPASWMLLGVGVAFTLLAALRRGRVKPRRPQSALRP